MNEIIDMDYRSYVIDINLEGYFNEEVSEWDKINKSILDSSKKYIERSSGN